MANRPANVGSRSSPKRRTQPAKAPRAAPRDIERTTAFRRDYRREGKGPHSRTLAEDLKAILERLVMDRPLDPRHVDHPLAGEWKDHRDCHVRPDLVLIYRKAGNALQLVRLGSHSELGL